MHAMAAVMEELPIACFFGEAAAHAGSGDDGGALAQVLSPFNAGGRDSFAGSDDGELGKAVHEAEGFAGKVAVGVVAKYGGAILETDLVHAHLRIGPDILRDGTDSRSTTRECLPKFLLVESQSADHA